MTLDEYQNEAKRTAPRSLDAYPEPLRRVLELAKGCENPYSPEEWGDPNGYCEQALKVFDVLIWGHGLAGEAGEVCDLLKKVHGHGKPYDADAMKKELGDVLWYVANLADAHGFTLSEVAQANVAKLRARYPGGFSVAAAQAKADEKCREFPNEREHFFCLKSRGHPGDHAASDGDGSLLCWTGQVRPEGPCAASKTPEPCPWWLKYSKQCGLPATKAAAESGAMWCPYHADCADKNQFDAGPAPGAPAGEEDAAVADARRNVDNLSNWCDQNEPGGGWSCSRPPGHEGDHVGVDDAEAGEVRRWPRSAGAAPACTGIMKPIGVFVCPADTPCPVHDCNGYGCRCPDKREGL